MDVHELKRQLARPATKFTAGGFRPTNADDESWIGRVFLYHSNESIPLDEAGIEMQPLAQLYLAGLPYCSPLMQGTRVLTLFISRTLPHELEPMGKNWLVREYDGVVPLERKDLTIQRPSLKPFPLRAELIEADFPRWDSGGIPLALEGEISRMEGAGEVESYHMIAPHQYAHKLGGYPSFCQSGVDVGAGFEFVLQIASDPKVGLSVVDGGCLMFWKNIHSGQWAMYYDFD